MKRAIFDLIKKAKLRGRGAAVEGSAMMNDNLNMCLPSVRLYFISFLATRWFIVALMLFSINQKILLRTFNEWNEWGPLTC